MIRYPGIALLALSLLNFAVVDTATAQAIPEPSPLKSQTKAPQAASKVKKKDVTTEAPDASDQRIYQSACPGLRNGLFKGKSLPPISEGQCGERSPLEVTHLRELELSNPVTLNCRMAEALADWSQEIQIGLTYKFKTRISKIDVSTHYQCRRRNNLPDGKISEHGFANALDITGIWLENGQKLSVENDWGKADDQTESNETAQLTESQKVLRSVRDIACKHFTTVLSPDSDPNHSDHFHFDLGCHGKSCTYLICE